MPAAPGGLVGPRSGPACPHGADSARSAEPSGNSVFAAWSGDGAYQPLPHPDAGSDRPNITRSALPKPARGAILGSYAENLVDEAFELVDPRFDVVQLVVGPRVMDCLDLSAEQSRITVAQV